MPKVTATVTLTIRVDVRDTWGEDCTLSQVLKQARQSALDALNNEAWASKTRAGLALVGEPLIIVKSLEP